MGGDASGNGNSVIESNGGNIVIEGGFFYTDYAYRNFYYVLNQQNGNFVADGYKVVTETHGSDTWYSVVAK